MDAETKTQRVDAQTGRDREVVAETRFFGVVTGTLRDWFQDGSANIRITSGPCSGMFTLIRPDYWRFSDEH